MDDKIRSVRLGIIADEIIDYCLYALGVRRRIIDMVDYLEREGIIKIGGRIETNTKTLKD